MKIENEKIHGLIRKPSESLATAAIVLDALFYTACLLAGMVIGKIL